MRRRYRTNLLGLCFGNAPTVVAFDYETIKEIETRPEFLGRMDTIVARERGLGKLLGMYVTPHATFDISVISTEKE
jgi:hypothetical protein